MATRQNYWYISDTSYEEKKKKERDKTGTKEIALGRSSELLDESSVIVMMQTDFTLS